MKVICINGVKIGEIALNTGEISRLCHVIYEGEIYNVIDEKYINKGLSYKLEERENGWYQAKRFINISDINELELIEKQHA